MSKLIEHARREIELAGLADKDADYEGKTGRDVLALVELFASQGHSGASAVIVTEVLNRLLKFKPLVPLTGEDKEWSGEEGELQQNVRASQVFRRPDGTCMDIEEGRDFVITFPYDMP